MNNITMLRLNQLEHHPDNPRLDLGDLTELTESIRSQGILQNLTVVRVDDNIYNVVIGNRRMEAAKLAGLAEVPCVISDMDYNTQIATMLTENMHRTDLTLYEQAQGIQMMMDLGLTQGQISEMTGFSRTTIKRRAEMARLDKKTLKEKCTQLTMDEMDQLMKIRDIDERNKLLKEAGTDNFKWKIGNAVKEQKLQDTYNQVKHILLQAGCIEKSTRGVTDFWKKYEYLLYSTSIDLDEYKAGENILPEDNRQLFFCREYGYVRFWAEQRKATASDDEDDGNDEAVEPAELSEEEIARRQEMEEVRNAWAKLEEIEKHARESREEFIKTLTVKQKESRKGLDWLVIALVASNDREMAITNLLPDYDNDQIEALPKGYTEIDLDLKWAQDQIDTNPQLYAVIIGDLFFLNEDCVANRWRRNEKPEYCRNIAMITGYEWLEDFGYPISDEERAYLDGTLDCYGKEEDE